jgi:hypothetical protein
MPSPDTHLTVLQSRRTPYEQTPTFRAWVGRITVGLSPGAVRVSKVTTTNLHPAVEEELQ